MLQVQDIAVSYHPNVEPVVRGVSLEVPGKSIVALLGANGAGKTTILRTISGLFRLHNARLLRGSILFENERIDHLAAPQIVQRGIAQVMEGRRLFADLSVEENLRVGAITVRDPSSVRSAYERVMDLFPALRERRKNPAGYLSGGEQQMVAIGRALMANPRLLLMDEPSLGLAPFMVQRIRQIISDINASGTAVLLVEQNAQMALSLARTGYVLETGRVVMARSASELLQDEGMRKFYLGIHEGGKRSNIDLLRQRRSEKREAL